MLLNASPDVMSLHDGRLLKSSVFIFVAIVLAFSWICIVETSWPFALCVSPVFKNI